MEFIWSSGELAEGLACYRREEFFAAHEHWEQVWRQCQGQPRLFLQGLIQVACAFHHFQRNNLGGAASLLASALHKLEPCGDTYAGVAVGRLCEELRPWLRELAPGEPSTRSFPHAFPTIHLPSDAGE